jgi:DNA-binding protein YbaB
MNMFSKLNQIKELKAQAKSMQNTLSQENIEVEKKGIILKMDGNQTVLSVKIPEDMENSTIESILPELFGDATKKVQKMMAEKMRNGEIAMPNFNF